MKHLLLFIFTLLAFQTSRAQYHGDSGTSKNIFISLGGEVGAPSNTPYNVSYGGYFGTEFKIMDHFGLTLAAEYIGYKYKSSILLNNADQHPSFTPLKAGLRYYTNSSFYFSGELGTTLPKNDSDNSMFVYSLGFGFDISVNKFSDVDVGFAYQNYTQSQYQTTGLKVAYRIGW